MPHAVICAYGRSPFTLASKGELAKTRPDDLLAQVIKGVLAKTPVDTTHIEDLIVGCAFPEGEQGFNIGRMVALLSGLPLSVAGSTINRWCGSSMEAIHMAAGKITSGAGELFLAGGVESMSRIPMGGFNPSPNPKLYENMPGAYLSMGITAENLQKKFAISRAEQEQFALKSHQKAASANLAGEIIPIAIKGSEVAKDGCIRADTSLEKMATLAPAFDEQGTVTAATSSPVTDGGAMTIIASEEYANKHGLPKLARIKAMAVSGLEPEIMGLGPVEASKKALARAGLKISDMDFVELNEAFAVQAMAVAKELGIDESKLNVEGGAVALGHPLGASGARVTGKAAMLLKQRGGNYALSCLCVGGGMGMATVLEKS
ncbi:MAG: thiolase family protein [Alphaproteobacteria bacterium]|nr:thiolase family protein [Alphaproteobacteria bacterium]